MRGADGHVTADRLADVYLARAWKPPRNRKRPRPAQPRAHVDFRNGSSSTLNLGEASAQRAVHHALRRVAELERRAAMMASVGLTDASLRLAAVAEQIRQVLA